jgi:hypothetical protein
MSAWTIFKGSRYKRIDCLSAFVRIAGSLKLTPPSLAEILFCPLRIVGYTEIDKRGQFEIRQTWAPSLDTSPFTSAILKLTKQFCSFERGAFTPQYFENVSRLGSQHLSSQESAFQFRASLSTAWRRDLIGAMVIHWRYGVAHG